MDTSQIRLSNLINITSPFQMLSPPFYYVQAHPLPNRIRSLLTPQKPIYTYLHYKIYIHSTLFVPILSQFHILLVTSNMYPPLPLLLLLTDAQTLRYLSSSHLSTKNKKSAHDIFIYSTYLTLASQLH